MCGAVGTPVCGALSVLPGAVWRACAWLGFRALLSSAVLRLVLLGCFCFVLLSHAAVFSADFFFALFRAFPWWSFLFSSVWCSAVVCLAVWCGPVALRSCAGFCCAVPFGAPPCRGASLGSVLCCSFRCGAWVASCLARCCGVLLCSLCVWARCCVVLPCCLWSVCCRSLCRVSGCLPFCGASCVVLCWCACVVAPCAVLSRPSGAGWCCVLLPVVFGCVLLGLAVLCCLLVAPGVVFRWCCPCLAVWLAALWFGVVCLGAPLRYVVVWCAVLSRGGVLWCPAVCLRRCPCMLSVSWRCAFCCVCPGVLPCGWSACRGALLPCVVSCGAVLSCDAALLCSGVFLRCCVCLLSRMVSCLGGAVPVWWCGSPPCGLVWCVSVLRSAVLCSVVLCCRVVVCCRTLLSVCVVACACCLFPGAVPSAVCVLVCLPLVGRLVVAPWSPVLCPVVLCCRVVLRCRVLVPVCGAVCGCRRFFPLKPLQNRAVTSAKC